MQAANRLSGREVSNARKDSSSGQIFAENFARKQANCFACVWKRSEAACRPRTGFLDERCRTPERIPVLAKFSQKILLESKQTALLASGNEVKRHASREPAFWTRGVERQKGFQF